MADDKILEAILKVRDCGKTNMLDMKAVQYYAYEMELYYLVTWIEKNGSKGYMKVLSETEWENVG